ncbi:hypothetical protein M501DRAFT_1048736 [Patellaria atrata CBS 101060]|uniref:Uncharacterized protein n=1 Tax=Patellaria atrata CBS 101060 TaxID=1346257 RepID=A0A9P4S0T9_9PEZI|nr:hypothetical protein M501DRAFT_1048736 [Patellaria atrata CBS 101060]
MLSSNLSSNLSKANVVLHTSSDWTRWIGMIRVRAGTAWKYCDPYKDTPPVLTPPSREITENPIAAALYRTDYEEYRLARTTLAQIDQFVFDSVSTQSLAFILGLDTLYERRVELKKRFQPDDRVTYLELDTRLYKLRSTVKKTGILDWLSRFEILYSEYKLANHPQYQGNMLEFELLKCLKRVDAQNQEDTQTREPEKHVDSVYDIISEFTNYYRNIEAIQSNIRASSASTALATFQGESNASSGDSDGKGKPGKSYTAQTSQTSSQTASQKEWPTCLCGIKHSFNSCHYINPRAKKPDNYSEKM